MSYDAIVLAVPCAQHGCGAKPYEFCVVYRVGGVRAEPHRRRVLDSMPPPKPEPITTNPLSLWCGSCSAMPGEPCTRGNRYTAQQLGRAVPPIMDAFHVSRQRAAGIVLPRPVERHSPSPAQVRAREQNWTLFQVTGALGNLRQAAQKQRLSNDSRMDLQIAIEALARIDERNKRGCP